MDWIKSYILSIIAAGIISGVCISLIPKNTASAKIIRMLGGIFLSLTLIAPLVKLRFDDIMGSWDEISLDAQAIAQEASANTQEALSSVIKQKLETYILDKAETLGVTLQVSVIMNQEQTPMPQQVTLKGAVSPYQQKILSDFIADDLGITEEQQKWK